MLDVGSPAEPEGKARFCRRGTRLSAVAWKGLIAPMTVKGNQTLTQRIPVKALQASSPRVLT
jgi:hypothetical protein